MQYDALLVDAMNLSYRSWWPCKDLGYEDPETNEFVHTGLEFGLLKNILALMREYYPAKLILCWDGIPVRGLSIYPEYKAGRNKGLQSEEKPWIPRLEVLRNMLSTLTLSLYHPEIEADEQIARMVHQRERENRSSLIISNDGDLYQLVSPLTHIKKDIYIDPDKVVEEWSVPPEKITLLRAIAGDKSDNITGIPRIATTTKVRLVKKATNIDHLIQILDEDDDLTTREREKLTAGKEIIRRNYQLMLLRNQTDPPTAMSPINGNPQNLLAFCERLGLKSLLHRKEWTLFKEKEEEWTLPDEVLAPER